MITLSWIEDNYGIYGFPFYTLVDEQGSIIENHTFNPSDEELEEKLLKLLR